MEAHSKKKKERRMCKKWVRDRELKGGGGNKTSGVRGQAERGKKAQNGPVIRKGDAKKKKGNDYDLEQSGGSEKRQTT